MTQPKENSYTDLWLMGLLNRSNNSSLNMMLAAAGEHTHTHTHTPALYLIAQGCNYGQKVSKPLNRVHTHTECHYHLMQDR